MSIVGIGASAGGIEALRVLFSAMPASDSLAIVVVTHQSEGRTSLLPELLSRCSAMPVEIATDGAQVVAGRVYVAPTGDIDIVGGRLRLRERSPNHFLPIDRFFRSLARDQGAAAAGVVLSGTGSDGSLGIREIAAHAGLTIAQDPGSAKFPQMPANAIATGDVDFVLLPEDIPERLVGRGSTLGLGADHDELERRFSDALLARIYALIRTRSGHDFSGYKTSTIRRRVDRRMRLHQIGDTELYLDLLGKDGEEADRLSKELLISVTSWFRDRPAFARLRDALVGLLSEKPEGESVRVWVPACSTGEEAYSIAILVRQCIDAVDRHFAVQVFATDVHTDSIDVARAGVYPAGIATEVGAEVLERYFVPHRNGFEVCKEVRDTVVFAVHDVLRDPPFPRLDLVSCRNLLIYLKASAQAEVLPLFHYGLRSGGLLLLGTSETIGPELDLFASIDHKQRLYQRLPGPPVPRRFARSLDKPSSRHLRRSNVDRKGAATPMASTIERAMLGRLAPPSVVVDSGGLIVHTHGRTGKWLELPSGRPQQNIIAMAREGLRIGLSSLLQRARDDDSRTVRERVRLPAEDGGGRVDVSIERLGRSESLRDLFLISFQECEDAVEEPASSIDGGDFDGDRMALVQRELQVTRETLQVTIEELEGANEELTSANEELQSTNEELQSTNEELETSREELQSLNEELQTVNAELQMRLEDLSHANDDMTNLLNSIEIATVFLDGDLNIKRFTESATQVARFIASDVGRPLADIASNLDYPEMLQDAREVLRTLVFKEREVSAKSGQEFLIRLMPYRTGRNLIDGLVMTAVNVDRLKRAERESRRLSTVIRNLDDAVIVQGLDGTILAWNRGAERLYGYSEREAVGMNILELVEPDRKAEVRDLCAKLSLGAVVAPFRTRRLTMTGKLVEVDIQVTLLDDGHGHPEAFSTTERVGESRQTPSNRQSAEDEHE